MLIIYQTLYLYVSLEYYEQILIALDLEKYKWFSIVFSSSSFLIVSIVFRKVDKLTYVGILGLGGLLFATISSIYECLKTERIEFEKLKLCECGFKVLDELPTVTYAFSSQFSIIPVTCVLKGNKMMSSRKVIVFSNAISIIICIITGATGYIAFPNTELNYLSNPLSGGCSILVLKFFLGSVNIFTYPMMMVSSRRALHCFVNMIKKVKSNFLVDSIESFIIVLITYIIVKCGAKPKALVDILSIPGSIIMFILPSLIFIKVKKRKNISSFIWFFITLNIIVGFILFIVSTIQSFKE